MLIGLLGSAPSTVAVSNAVEQLIGLFQKLKMPPRKSIVGLVGELVVIMVARDATQAVEAWRSDPDERYDFTAGNLRLEAKASSTRSRVHALSLEQATPPNDTVGLLASVYVEQAGGGKSVQSLLSAIESKLPSYEAILKLRMVVAETLGHELVSAMGWCFDLEQGISSVRFFDLKTIPAIRGTLPTEVSGVRFSTNLSNVEPAGAGLIGTVCVEGRQILPSTKMVGAARGLSR